jgi:hypothetical protein
LPRLMRLADRKSYSTEAGSNTNARRATFVQ